MRQKTSTHFQVMTVSIIASALAGQFGGVKAAWTAIAGSIASNAYCLNNKNVYETVYYYYQPSYDDPQLPYRIKQVTFFYEDSSRTKLIDINTRYYYSNMTW
ncbi:hypothetical protein [Desulforamulus ruminis]|uniref:hypothetical protein n=1 Tax=Desulforamulus ruminis TaxID=1564 RepID=UPI001180F559|nr:hypothetical protein [Desulforamulus ruminis]